MSCKYCTNRTKHGHDADYIAAVKNHKQPASETSAAAMVIREGKAYHESHLEAKKKTDDIKAGEHGSNCEYLDDERGWTCDSEPDCRVNDVTPKAEHTPTPWDIDWSENYRRYQLRSKKGSFGHFEGWAVDGVTTEDEDRANAEFIVRAVNSHKALLEVVKNLKKYAWANDPNSMSLEFRAIINQACDAVALAKE